MTDHSTPHPDAAARGTEETQLPTFDELLAHGRAVCGSGPDEIPWSFKYQGMPVTHENDNCYLLLTPTGSVRIERSVKVRAVFPSKEWCLAAAAREAEVYPSPASAATPEPTRDDDGHRPNCASFIGELSSNCADCGTPKRSLGLYRKFKVTRMDGSDAPGGKHDGCEYFVLDRTHDPFAAPALRAYADACAREYPKLAADLRAAVAEPAPEGGETEKRQRVSVIHLGPDQRSCRACNLPGEHAEAVVQTRKGEGVYADTPLLTITQSFFRCPKCGVEWLTEQQSSAFEKQLSTATFHAYRGLLAASEQQRQALVEAATKVLTWWDDGVLEFARDAESADAIDAGKALDTLRALATSRAGGAT